MNTPTTLIPPPDTPRRLVALDPISPACALPPQLAAALRRDWQLYSLAVLPLLFFAGLPLPADDRQRDRVPPVSPRAATSSARTGSGCSYLRMFLTDPTFWNVFTNTLVLGALTLLFCFPLPIVLALLLNEVRSPASQAVRAVGVLPAALPVDRGRRRHDHAVALHRRDGQPGRQGCSAATPIAFMQQPEWFRTIYVSSEVWQTVGWGTILYLAALTTIDEDLYEAARIDGANRWRQTWHVTLPGIRPTMVTLLILNIGAFMAVGFEKILLLYNPLTYPTADVISTYLYRIGFFPTASATPRRSDCSSP